MTETPAARKRRFTATRLLAHRLFHRALTVGPTPDPERADAAFAPAPPDQDAALRLVDERLVPGPEARHAAAAEALLLCRAALAVTRPGGMLDGRLRTNLRINAPRAGGGVGVVSIPTLIQGPDGMVSVVAMQPSGEPLAVRRARCYRRAAAILFDRPVRAFIVRPDGSPQELPARRTRRSEPTAAANRDRGCSPSAHRRSGRRPR